MSDRIIFTNATVITGFATVNDCGLFIDNDGTIGDIFYMTRMPKKKFPEDTIVIDAQGCTITPGFFDSHIHGIGGAGTEDCNPASILKMSERLADYGVTDFLPTIYTDEFSHMLAAERAIVEAMGKEKGATIRGINIEGPFISPKRIGAQNPDGALEVSIPRFHELLEAGQGKIICMTVAPELKGMRDLALEATKEGIVLLAGHTDATYENIMEGIQCGILHSTHFFNAMSRLHHRNPGCVGTIMINQDMCCEIIADGVHVHPEIVKLLVREKPKENIVLVTDSLRPTKQRSGKLLANGVPARLGEEGAWVSAADPDQFLGSALVLIKAVKNMVSWGIPIDNAIQMASTNPSRIYHFNDIGSLIPGKRANITIFDDTYQIKCVIVNGTIIRDDF
ncbi:MAG: N-acetylglucosamine-6-phosphate deacetylase [Sphaerochaetaceae bacterium]|jgi:N-acetylglucosamine-6-phosphate deacetylase|nr:N-acetylglucosamine-6-phosphate deacetylase [Sphaerochaetaceae bacterium]